LGFGFEKNKKMGVTNLEELLKNFDNQTKQLENQYVNLSIEYNEEINKGNIKKQEEIFDKLQKLKDDIFLRKYSKKSFFIYFFRKSEFNSIIENKRMKELEIYLFKLQNINPIIKEVSFEITGMEFNDLFDLIEEKILLLNEDEEYKKKLSKEKLNEEKKKLKEGFLKIEKNLKILENGLKRNLKKNKKGLMMNRKLSTKIIKVRDDLNPFLIKLLKDEINNHLIYLNNLEERIKLIENKIIEIDEVKNENIYYNNSDDINNNSNNNNKWYNELIFDNEIDKSNFLNFYKNYFSFDEKYYNKILNFNEINLDLDENFWKVYFEKRNLFKYSQILLKKK
jgi:hypothetical protein